MDIEELKNRLEENTNRIIANMNELHSHEEMISNNYERIQRNSYALDILKDYKSENKRLFIILIIVLFMWFLTIGYLVYVLNDIGTIKDDTIEVEGVQNIDNSHIKIGDDIWEKSE